MKRYIVLLRDRVVGYSHSKEMVRRLSAERRQPFTTMKWIETGFDDEPELWLTYHEQLGIHLFRFEVANVMYRWITVLEEFTTTFGLLRESANYMKWSESEREVIGEWLVFMLQIVEDLTHPESSVSVSDYFDLFQMI